jgi:hypothetical protein
MKLLAIALFGLALTVPAFARIGETLDQAKQRYGKIKKDDTFKGLRRVEFERNGFRVVAIFLDDRIGAIIFSKLPTQTFRKSDEMSETEVQNFLKANGGEKEWKQVAERTWTAPGLSAWYFYDMSGPTDSWVWLLAIQTDETTDKIAAYEAAEQTKNQEGF